MPGRFASPGRRRREAGNVTVELGLALPLLLLMLGGTLDLGMLFWEKQVLTNATREGARAAAKAVDHGGVVVADKTQSQVRQVVQGYLDRYHLKDLNGQRLILTGSMCTYTWSPSSSGMLVTVALNQIPYRMMLLPNVRSWFGTPRQPGDSHFYLNAVSTMAAEWPATSPPPP
jgi:Flp pilus assembly protein TadG